MKKENDFEMTEVNEIDNEEAKALRARNRTVMLSPDITGQVRARLGQEGLSRVSAQSVQSVQPAAVQNTHVPAQQPIQSAYRMTEPVATEQIFRSEVSPAVNTSATSMRPSQEIISDVTRKSDNIHWAKKGPVMGFLVSYDVNPDGDVFNLYTGRLIISSEPTGTGSCLVIVHESVSPMHAILRIAASGEVQVLDQLSEYGTKIKHFGKNGFEELSGDRGSLEHGAMIVFGERKFYYCQVIREYT